MDSKNEREMLEAWIQKFPDERIIEIVNEMNRCKDCISEFVYKTSQSVHGDKEFVIDCIFDEYDQRKKRLVFVVLIFCNWIKNLKMK